MTIKITFLGTADAIPTAKRNHQAILLSYDSENILIDCGEGTQRQFRKAGLNPMKLTRILITHWHGDHILGIPGLLQTLAFSDYNKTLYIYGPKGTKKYIKELLKTFIFANELKIKIEEVDGKFFENDDFYLESRKMTHGCPCNAYVFVKKGNFKIDKNKLKKSGLPQGPILQKLKQGKDIVYKGKKYFAKDLIYRVNDLKISFVLDTSLNKDIVPFVKDSDLLVCESAFDSKLVTKARKHKHLTAKQVGEIAKKAKVKKLILTHISQRYDKNPKKILGEVRKIFKKSYLVNDLDVIEV